MQEIKYLCLEDKYARNQREYGKSLSGQPQMLKLRLSAI